MDEWTIIYNPRCSKSREALQLLHELGIQPRVVDYLASPLSAPDIEYLMAASQEAPAAFVRTKETVFTDLAPVDLSTPAAVATLLSRYPALLERPLVRRGHKVVIARPPDKLKSLL